MLTFLVFCCVVHHHRRHSNPWPFWIKSRWTSYLHRGLSQSGNRITVEVLLLFVYDEVMSSLWHGQSRLPTEVHRSGRSASRWASVCLGQSKVSGSRAPTSLASRRWTCPDCSYQNYAWREYCHYCSRAVRKQWWWQSCKEAGSATDFRGLPLGGVRKVAGRRVSQFGGDGGRGCGFGQDRGAGSLEGLGCEHGELEKARGGKPDVAIGEILQQKRLERQELKDQMQSRKSTKAPLERRSRQRKRRASSSRVCRRRR